MAFETDPGIGPNRQWNSVAGNCLQEQLLHLFANRGELLSILNGEEFAACASREVSVVNEFLRANSFDIQLEEDSGGVAVASFVRLLMKWREPGTKDSIRAIDGNYYPGAKLENGFTVFQLDDGSEFLSVETQSGDNVCMMIAKEPLEGFELLAATSAISFAPRTRISDYDHAIIPMIDLDDKPDLSYMLGMNTTGQDGRPCIITQALQQTRIKQNELGAKAESAAAMFATRGFSMEVEFLVDGPCLWWVLRKGSEMPIFAAYLDYDSWKEPVSIN